MSERNSLGWSCSAAVVSRWGDEPIGTNPNEGQDSFPPSYRFAAPRARRFGTFRSSDASPPVVYRLDWPSSTKLLVGSLGRPRCQPALQRRLALSRGTSGEQPFQTDVLFQYRPVDSMSCVDDPPVRAFVLGRGGQPRVPRANRANRNARRNHATDVTCHVQKWIDSSYGMITEADLGNLRGYGRNWKHVYKQRVNRIQAARR